MQTADQHSVATSFSRNMPDISIARAGPSSCTRRPEQIIVCYPLQGVYGMPRESAPMQRPASAVACALLHKPVARKFNPILRPEAEGIDIAHAAAAGEGLGPGAGIRCERAAVIGRFVSK